MELWHHPVGNIFLGYCSLGWIKLHRGGCSHNCSIISSYLHFLYQITDAYLSNRQPDKPKRCHQLIYDVMSACWNIYPEQRISFMDICNALNEVSGATTVRYKISVKYLASYWATLIKLDFKQFVEIFQSSTYRLIK